MKIYTKTGDKGTTSLYHHSERRTKCDPQICTVGDVDELNSQIGVVLVFCSLEISYDLEEIQRDLFKVGTNLATPVPVSKDIIIDEKMYTFLESRIDYYQRELADLTDFILPGGCQTSAQLHLARTICRRAERSVVYAKHELLTDDFDNVIIYLNRLSDLLFVLARFENKMKKIDDVIV
jgi:cob(I)alamin adenosyltransferase